MWYLLGLVVLTALLFRSRIERFLEGDFIESEDRQSDGFDTDVVGESHYQKNLLKICGRKTPDGVELFIRASLVLEANNPHDTNAVRVDIGGMTVGYLPKPQAVAWRAARPAQVEMRDAVICCGWDRGESNQGHFGVKLRL